jgi:2'-5' RNA ligase
MRLFVAVNFNDTVLDAVEATIGDFPIRRPPWRWSDRTTWHVTLKFLGETDEPALDAIGGVLAEAATRHSTFDVALGGLDGFPNLHRPRVLFYQVVSGADAMEALCEDINRSLANQVGIRAETKPFRAHVTVARVKTRIGRPAVDALRSAASLDGVSQTVSGFDLMESQLGKKGSKYTRLKGFALG